MSHLQTILITVVVLNKMSLVRVYVKSTFLLIHYSFCICFVTFVFFVHLTVMNNKKRHQFTIYIVP